MLKVLLAALRLKFSKAGDELWHEATPQNKLRLRPTVSANSRRPKDTAISFQALCVGRQESPASKSAKPFAILLIQKGDTSMHAGTSHAKAGTFMYAAMQGATWRACMC